LRRSLNMTWDESSLSEVDQKYIFIEICAAREMSLWKMVWVDLLYLFVVLRNLVVAGAVWLRRYKSFNITSPRPVEDWFRCTKFYQN
jgi:hypothetical protein